MIIFISNVKLNIKKLTGSICLTFSAGGYSKLSHRPCCWGTCEPVSNIVTNANSAQVPLRAGHQAN